MEDKNSNQSEIEPQQTSENQPVSNPVSGIGQKGNTLIIVGFVFLMAIIGVGAYYLGISKNVKTTQAPQSTTTIQPTPTTSPQDETANWKTYTNTKYGFLLKYPNDLPAYNGSATSKKDELVDMETTDSVIFGCNGFGVGVCLPTFSVSKSSLNNTQINSIFNLKVGDQVNKDMTYTLGGMWNQKTDYKRLPDQTTNGVNFLVLDNPSGYGGSNRIWFLRNDTTFQFNCVYSKTDVLTTCQNIINSFKFISQSQTSDQIYLYLARKSVFLRNTENVGTQGTEKTGGTPVDIVIPLPPKAVVQTLINQNRQQKLSVTINGTEFWVNVFGNPNEGCAPSCTGTDSVFDANGIHIDTLRVWKDSRGVLDINPQTITINNYSIPYFTIQKNKPNNVFTDSEVNLWMDLLGKIKIIPVNQ